MIVPVYWLNSAVKFKELDQVTSDSSLPKRSYSQQTAPIFIGLAHEVCKLLFVVPVLVNLYRQPGVVSKPECQIRDVVAHRCYIVFSKLKHRVM